MIQGIDKLYKREDLYRKAKYGAAKIFEMRNDSYTQGIIDELQNEMYNLMANRMDKLSKLPQGALKSAMFNTFIQTCKQAGISFRQYFKALFKAIKAGRTDYENLLPMTICLK